MGSVSAVFLTAAFGIVGILFALIILDWWYRNG